MQIKFGTDGWRDLIAENYTFENVHRVARGAALYFKKHPKAKAGVFVGYDGRFLSREFAELTARVLANEGLKVFISDAVISTPGTSLAIVKKKLAGGVMITASHNPAQYNGFKIKGYYGGAGLPDAVAEIEKDTNSEKNRKHISANPDLRSFEELKNANNIQEVDARGIYLKELTRLIDLKKIERSKIKIAYDPMYGANVGCLEELIPDVAVLHNVWNPGFGRTRPEPLPDTTKELAKYVTENRCDIGLVTDGDADRIGAIDEIGAFFSSQMILCLLLEYLVETRKKKGTVVISQSVTSMIDKMCEKYGLQVIRTPVGFKYITEYMLKGGVLIGGEESGGIGIPSLHIPERDGLYNGLLLCEICANQKKSLGQLVAQLEKEYGPRKYDRYDHHTTHEQKEAVLAKAKKGFNEIAGLKVKSVSTLDGYKYILDKGAWFMLRASGTEPLLRYYAEAPTMATVKKILAFAKGL
ncbi:MAG TPA: phosphoglucomutase/phosphomannomutase family protein [Candidatus Kapabacteria bacterium]|jgi:phosphomannomutase